MKKVKVLHVVSNLNRGGAETMIMNIYRNIDKQKFQFDFLCLTSINGAYEQEIKDLGGNIYKVASNNNKMKTLYRILKENNYDAIHSHVMFYSGFIQLIAKLAKVKIRITHSHSANDIKKETILRKVYMTSTRFLINRCSNIKISCAEKAGEYLYGKRGKIIILNNGIVLNRFTNITEQQIQELKKELKISKDDLIIGHVGSFVETKNQEFFIGVAKELLKKNIKFKIVLVGQGARINYIKELIEKEKLEKYFVMPGLRDDIPTFMNMFDVFIMPSLYEGFPLAVVEALAGNNICYLSNNISKETNIIKSRVRFFDLNDSKMTLIENIQEDLKNKSNVKIQEKLNEKGFSIEKMTEKITNIYLGKS